MSRSRRASTGRGVYVRRRLLVALGLLLLFGAATLVGFRLLRPGTLPGLRVAGVDVGDLERKELAQRLEEIAGERERSRFAVVRRARGAVPMLKRSYRRVDAGYSFDVDATVERVLERGRQPNPIPALIDHFSATVGEISVAPVEHIDPQRLGRWLARTEERFTLAPVEGRLRFERGEVVPVMPRAGAAVDSERLMPAIRSALRKVGRPHVTLPIEPARPATTEAAVRAAAARARKVLSDSVTLKRGGHTVDLPPPVIGRSLETVRDGSRLDLRVSAKALAEAAGPRLARLERGPVDASFGLSGGTVRVIPARPGFGVDRERLAAKLISIASSKSRSGVVPGRATEPELTTREARDLDIDRQVSSFTTAHSCCEPRVQNIHRIADLIDGTVVLPGETFSINDTVGERTRAKGFVPAPAIFEGEYVEEVGGGISQFATTMFNAIFFGGYDFVEYKAHSYYISRYPMGREATLSYPSVDLAFTNDSDGGIYIDTSYSDTTITVTFYGSVDRDVRASAGEPHSYTRPPVQCEENRSLGRGERRVIQDGSRGFDITVRRIFGGGEMEEFFTRYLPEPRIVERRSC